ncbi:ethanolamine ammonia-lyase subunit EutB [Escherichia coli]|nr:ethanolamine ammonia-lyase subunit EutB [Escherichia coli]
MPVIKKANTTIGIPGTFSARLQPNDTRDDVKSIAAQISRRAFLRGGAMR